MMAFVIEVSGKPLTCAFSRKDQTLWVRTSDLRALNGHGLHDLVMHALSDGVTTHPALSHRARLTWEPVPVGDALKHWDSTARQGDCTAHMVELAALLDHIDLFKDQWDYTDLIQLFGLGLVMRIVAAMNEQLGLIYMKGVDGRQLMRWPGDVVETSHYRIL